MMLANSTAASARAIPLPIPRLPPVTTATNSSFLLIFVYLRTSQFRSGQFVEKEINGGNAAVAGNDEVCPSDCWLFTGSTLCPSNASAVSHFLGFSNWLIPKVMVHNPEFACDAVDLVAATIDSPFGIIKYGVLCKDLVDGVAPVHWIVFTEDVVKISG